MTRRPAGLMLAVVLFVTGCGSSGTSAPRAATSLPPFADCAVLTSAPPSPGTPGPSGSVAPGGAPSPPRPLPDLELPCFGGDTSLRLPALRGPAIVNLWASWCGPCLQELPVLQRYADRAAGQVRLVGVVTEDRRPAAESLAVELKLHFPNLYDDSAQLRRALARPGLPITLFVDGRSQIRLLYNAGALDEDTLALLAEQYLGVVVP